MVNVVSLRGSRPVAQDIEIDVHTVGVCSINARIMPRRSPAVLRRTNETYGVLVKISNLSCALHMTDQR